MKRIVLLIVLSLFFSTQVSGDRVKYSGVVAGTFLSLSDTPSSYSGEATKVAAVNAGETALEFVAAGAGDVTSVGDCASGACFDGTSDGGTYLDFYDAQGRTRLIGGNTTAEANITLPSTTGTLIHTEADPNVDSSAEIQAIIGAGVYQASDADLTTLSGPTAWRMFYSDASQVIQQVALGADGTFLESNGAAAAPAFRTLADGDIPNNITIDLATVATTARAVDASGAASCPYGSADVTDHTFTTDGTGDAEIVFPNDSIGPAEIDSTTGAYDFGGVTSFKIPTAADVSGHTAEGLISWDSDDDKLYVGDGAAAKEIGGAGGGYSVYLEEGDVAKLDNSAANMTIDYGSGFDIAVTGTEADITLDLTEVVGNVNITKNDPEMRLTDTGDNEYTRVTRSDTLGKAIRYNRTSKVGGAGNSLDFDGSDDYAQVLDVDFDLNDDTGSHTVSIWLNLDSAMINGNFVNLADSGSPGSTRLILMAFDASVGNIPWLGLVNGDGLGRHTCAAISYDVWTHIAMVVNRSAKTITAYINGSQDGDVTNYTGTMVLGANDIRLGEYMGGDVHMNGKLDELGIWNKALSANDISDLYNAGSGLYIDPTKTFPTNGGSMGTSLGLVYHFNESTGSNIEDSAGTNDATCYNMGNDDWELSSIVGDPSSDTEVVVWSSQDGTASLEEGIQTFGDAAGRTVLDGKTVRFNIGGTEKTQIDGSGNWNFKSAALTVPKINFAADAEASDTYVITLSPAPTAYTTGMMIVFTANTLNTGACTVNVNALGAIPLKMLHDQDPADSYIEAGSVVVAVYDGTNFQLIQPDANP